MSLIIEQGLDFLLSHFEDPNHCFPRTISTKNTQNRQVKVYSKSEALAFFRKSEFLDCRISAFGKYEQEKIIPNLIFVDLDYRDALNECLILFYKTIGARPTVLDTGKGFAILQPIKMSSWITMAQGNKKGYELSKLFLQWTERYLTNNKCDLANHPSLKNTMIRVPGTFNTKLLNSGKSKEGSKVNVEYRWDKVRADVKRLPFKKHVNSIIKKENERRNINKANIKNFEWVEKLFEFKLHDGRERILYDVCRYLINLKGYSIDESVQRIASWLDSRYYSTSLIRAKCKVSIKDCRFPRRLDTIRKSDLELYQLIPKEIRL